MLFLYPLYLHYLLKAVMKLTYLLVLLITILLAEQKSHFLFFMYKTPNLKKWPVKRCSRKMLAKIIYFTFTQLQWGQQALQDGINETKSMRSKLTVSWVSFTFWILLRRLQISKIARVPTLKGMNGTAQIYCHPWKLNIQCCSSSWS